MCENDIVQTHIIHADMNPYHFRHSGKFFLKVVIFQRKKNQCTHCNKRFSENTLKIHLKTHAGEKPY